MHLLKIEKLNKYVYIHEDKADQRILRDVTLEIPEGQRIGLIGESGCGKTTLAKTILHLNYKSSHPLDSGSITYRDKPLHNLSPAQFRPYRFKMQMIYQDPFTSLNQKMTVEKLLVETLKLKHPRARKKELQSRMMVLASEFSIHPNQLNKRPPNLSGGECRRVGIARVMALEPDFLIADEPVASLDASIKDQIMELLVKRVSTLLTISHDLRIISKYSNMVVVMYAGSIMEIIHEDNTVESIHTPGFQFFHPYSKVLERSIIYFNQKNATLPDLKDETVTNSNGTGNGATTPLLGCPYANHCALIEKLSPDSATKCTREVPPLQWHATFANLIACHHQSNGQN